MSRVGIFGGSFNPVHHGHMNLANYALSELNLDKIYFVPAFQNPLKKTELAGTRISQLRKAISANSKFILSGIELKRKGLSYTVDTLKYFHKKFRRGGSRTRPRATTRVAPTLFFLAGADQIKNFSRWKSKEDVLKMCRFVIATRPGNRMNFKDSRFLWLPMPPMDVSSTQIRKELSHRH